MGYDVLLAKVGWVGGLGFDSISFFPRKAPTVPAIGKVGDFHVGGISSQENFKFYI